MLVVRTDFGGKKCSLGVLAKIVDEDCRGPETATSHPGVPPRVFQTRARTLSRLEGPAGL